jgi:glycosyltransferase involved in cell wall biosynthesis
MFSGNMGPFQRIETAIRAAAAVEGQADLVLVGSGTDEPAARRLADELGATNIRFSGPAAARPDGRTLCRRRLPARLPARPAWVAGHDSVQVQAALACGSPVVVSAGGDAARLVGSAGLGVACPPEDWRALADRFAEVAATSAEVRAAMARRAQRVYQERMSLRVGADQIEDMLTKTMEWGSKA